jgi:hypothetical protein
MWAGGDGDLRGGEIRRRRLVLENELPEARRNKLHLTAEVAWDLFTEEEGCWVRLLPSMVKNRGGLVQGSLGAEKKLRMVMSGTAGACGIDDFRQLGFDSSQGPVNGEDNDRFREQCAWLGRPVAGRKWR